MLRSETAQDPERLRRALAGLRRYQEATRPSAPPPPPGAPLPHGACLRDYGGEGPTVLFVPSLINPPTVLDLPGRSLLRWLTGAGLRPLLLDWGWAGPERADLSLMGHVEHILLPAIAALPRPPLLAGYCLGGTMALAAASAREVAGVALIAAPWRFAGFPDAARSRLSELWRGAAPAAERLGLLPMEVLQSAFWSLDPARTVAKFEDFAGAQGEAADTFVTLEDWANDGPPVPLAAAHELFEDLFAADASGRGAWPLNGRRIDPASLPCPILDIVSTRDRIVPAASALSAAGPRPPRLSRIELDLGHVGMMVGSRAEAALWRPLAGWLSEAGASC
jgi:polyhydroxyalkanoate synthase subunit PhaC